MECDTYQLFYTSDKTCRSCLSTHESLLSIPTKIFTFCTSLPVNEHDGLPAVLCQTCFDNLNNFYYFKQQCIRSDSILRQKTPSTSNELLARNSPNEEIPSYCNLDSKSKLNNVVNDKGATNNYLRPTNHDLDETEKGQIGAFISGGEMKKCKVGQKKKTTKLLYCQKCDKTFYKYVKLEAHMRRHFGLKPDSVIKCNQCEKTFSTEKNLKSHLRVHSGERKYKCKSCGKAFAYSNVLKNHERAHAGIKKYACQQCGKKFVQLTNLNTHIQMHTGEKPFSCGTCGRSFRQISELKMHLLRHTGVRDFACHICSLRFYTNFSLQKHMGVHSDERPFICSICEKRFKSQAYMIVHQRSHTGERPFICDFCPMAFMSAKDRRNHRKTHTGEKSSPTHKKLEANGMSSASIVPSSELSDSVKIADDITDYNRHSLSELTPLKTPTKPHCAFPNVNLPHEHYNSYDKSTQNDFIQPNLENKTNCSYISTLY